MTCRDPFRLAAGFECPGRSTSQPHGAHGLRADEEPDGIPGGNRRLTELEGITPIEKASASRQRRALF